MTKQSLPLLPPLRSATLDDIPAILQLADVCVGPGLYLESDVMEIFNRPQRVMLVQDGADGEMLGYYFGYLLSAQEASELMKFSPEQETQIFPDLEETVAMCKSIGVSPKARGHRLGFLLQSTATRQMLAAGAKALYGVAWRQGEVVVMDHMLRQLGFSYLFDTQRVWYDVEGLECPSCKQPRCICPAAIYMRKGELSYETQNT